MEFTDTVTFRLTKEGAYVFNCQMTSGMCYMETKITNDVLFKEGDIYKTKLYDLFKLFSTMTETWFVNKPLFTDIQVVKEEMEEQE